IRDFHVTGVQTCALPIFDVLMGSFLSHVGLALTDFAQQKKRFFLAAEPLTDKIVWEQGNRYTFRLRPSTYMQVAMLVPEAAKLRSEERRVGKECRARGAA